MVGVGRKLKSALQDCRTGAGAKSPIEEGAGPVGDDLGGIEIVFGTEAVAGWAGAVRRIETEGTRLKLGHGNAAIRAGQLFRENVFLAANDGDGYQASRQL